MVEVFGPLTFPSWVALTLAGFWCRRVLYYSVSYLNGSRPVWRKPSSFRLERKTSPFPKLRGGSPSLNQDIWVTRWKSFELINISGSLRCNLYLPSKWGWLLELLKYFAWRLRYKKLHGFCEFCGLYFPSPWSTFRRFTERSKTQGT